LSKQVILVTGAGGQLGQCFKAIAPPYRGFKMIYLDSTQLDVTNEKGIEQALIRYNPSVITNCAAYTAVDRAEQEREKAYLLNSEAPALLAMGAEKIGAILVHYSTDFVFSGAQNRPYVEDDAIAPISVYGQSKAEGEKAVSLLNKGRSILIRTSWLYSPFGHNFVKTMLKLSETKRSLNVVFDQVGTPTSGLDLARATLQLLEKGVQAGVYHYSNEGVASWYDLAQATFRIAGITKCEVEPIRSEAYPTLAKRPAYSVLDKTKIKEEVGLGISHWETALEYCMRHF